MRFVLLIGLAVFVVLALVACGGGSASAPPGSIPVTLKEFSIEPKPLNAKAGKVTFSVKNAGAIEHDIEIVGVGKIDSIIPNETRTLEVTLKAGTYDVVCTLSGHKEAGMVGKLVVSP
jgi:uncharacterized cupredoxin-like copper-binding protein